VRWKIASDGVLQHTTHEGHAGEVVAALDPGSVDGVVCVSGDGLVNEVLNGLLRRDDDPRAHQLPVGHVPAGSGNAIAKSLSDLAGVCDRACLPG
jgi:sphingosine kinase